MDYKEIKEIEELYERVTYLNQVFEDEFKLQQTVLKLLSEIKRLRKECNKGKEIAKQCVRERIAALGKWHEAQKDRDDWKERHDSVFREADTTIRQFKQELRKLHSTSKVICDYCHGEGYIGRDFKNCKYCNSGKESQNEGWDKGDSPT